LFSLETKPNHRTLEERYVTFNVYLIAFCSRLSSLSLVPHWALQRPHTKTINFTVAFLNVDDASSMVYSFGKNINPNVNNLFSSTK
jgi:hypothetical protein